eukprot:1372910-Heterocapsa_arctica.AAC.1
MRAIFTCLPPLLDYTCRGDHSRASSSEIVVAPRADIEHASMAFCDMGSLLRNYPYIAHLCLMQIPA